MYGRVKGTLKKGHTYELKIVDNFDAFSIGSRKYVVLTEIGNFGGKNEFMAWLLIGTGLVSVVLIVVFLALFMSKHYGKRLDNDDYIKTLKF